MKRKIIIVLVLCFLAILVSYTVNGMETDWSDTWEFDYQEVENYPPQYDPQGFEVYETKFFGGKGVIQGNYPPILSNPNPSNGSWENLISQYDWNVTIENDKGDTFNWTIEGSSNIGINASNDCSNGSYNITISGNLSYGTTYTVWVNATDNFGTNRSIYNFHTENTTTFNIINTLSFGGKADITGNPPPTFSNPSPSNESTDVSVGTTTWNVTISDTENFNWTIEGSQDIGINGANEDTNGSKTIDITSNLSYFTTYYIWVNATDNLTWSRAIYEFTTQYSGINVTMNSSDGVEETNVTLWGYLNTNDSRETTCWFQADTTSDFSSIDVNSSNGTIAEGTLFYANVTGFDNGTYYYIRTAANNTYGWNVSWNYTNIITKPQPATSLVAAGISGGFNLTWTHGNGFNESVLVMNQDNYPQHANDGQTLYQGTNDFYQHTSLNVSETYYYRVWEYVNWGGLYQFSDGNESTYGTYQAEQPVLKSPNPANETTEVNISITTWNVTIESPRGLQFNFTIEGSEDIGINASDNCPNGSYFINISGNLSELTTYTIWVNASETSNFNWTNETFWFTTGQLNLTLYATLSFGGKVEVQGNDPVISDEAPTNETYEVNLYPWLNVTVTDPQGTSINVTWLYDLGDGWVEFAYNTTTSGSTVRQRPTWINYSYTKYNWSVHVNDSDKYWDNETFYFYTANYSWGNWSSWWEFNYTCCCGVNFTASAYNSTVINLTWNNCESGGCDLNVVMVNDTNYADYPYYPSNGTLLYNGTNETYNHTGLAKSVSYYYAIWGYNISNNNYSLINYTDSIATQGDLDSCCPYPANHSTENSRPPTNISAIGNGTNIEVYLYFWNMTPTTDLWTLGYNWSSASSDRFSMNELTSNNGTTEFIWGNTTYIWSMNITDGTSWYNWTFNYTTEATANGANARYDVDNDDTVNVFDLNSDWTHRSAGSYDYDGLYDVDDDGTINVFDLNAIWTGRS